MIMLKKYTDSFRLNRLNASEKLAWKLQRVMVAIIGLKYLKMLRKYKLKD